MQEKDHRNWMNGCMCGVYVLDIILDIIIILDVLDRKTENMTGDLSNDVKVLCNVLHSVHALSSAEARAKVSLDYGWLNLSRRCKLYISMQ